MAVLYRLLTCRCCYAAEVAGVEYEDMDMARARATQGSRPTAEALREKWIGFLEAMSLGTTKKYDIDSTAYVFQIMLRMYAHRVVVHELEALYSHRPERFIFFVPQFVNFALHGAQDATMGALEHFLLEKSAKSLRFAHRLFWFVRAFSPADVTGSLVEQTEQRALMACAALSPVSGLAITDSTATETAAGLLPAVEEGDTTADVSPVASPVSQNNTPTSPTPFHFEPIKPLPRLAPGPPHVLGVNEFRWAVSFFDELTHMGGTLSAAPETTRNKMLRATLRALQAEYLPSDVMYLPIGKRPSRVVGIVADDSFCFKTNTRVPYLVCLEVVDDVGSFNDDGTFDTPGARESDPSQTEKKSGVQRQASGDLGDRIKSRLGQLKTSLQRHLSTSSQLSAGGVMLQTFSTTESVGTEYHDFGVPSRPTSPGSSHGADEDLRARRSRAGSFDEARLGLERAKQFTAHTKDPSKQMARTPRRSADDAVLGQWTPRSVAANDLPGGGRGAGFSHFVHHKDFDFEDQRDTAREKLAAQGAERSREASFASSTEGNFVEIELSSHASARMPPSARSYGSEDSMLRALNDGEDFAILKDAPTVVVPSDEPSVTPTYHHDEKENHWADEAQSDRDALVPSASRVAFANGMSGDEPVFDDEGDLEKMHGHAGDGDDDAAADDDDDEATGKSQTVIFRERWADKTKRVAAQSRWSHLPSWSIVPIIVKSDDDLRQEQFAAQLIALFDSVYREDGLPLRLHPYDVLAVSPDSGLIQAVPDTISLDSLKKNDTDYTTLRNFFIRYFGRPKSPAFKRAQSNFCESLAAYCIVCYLLQIKDRHNGNLLINAEGHIVHIDFGYLLSSQGPGNMNFERDVPFKITSEFVQLLDGPDSALFRRFRTLCCKAFLAARKRREQFILMIEMMLSNEADLDCFQAGGEETIRQLNERFQVGKSTAACITFVNDLIDVSINHYRTWLYDVYQRLAVGIKY